MVTASSTKIRTMSGNAQHAAAVVLYLMMPTITKK
jgi:hypothetical protein